MEHFIGFQWPLQLDILVYFGLLFLLSQAAGRIANWLGAPRIIGYMMAGVAIGLALDAKDLMNTISPILGSLIVSAVVAKTLLNEIITPFLVRFALIKAEETDVKKAHFRLPLALHGRKGRLVGHRKGKL